MRDNEFRKEYNYGKKVWQSHDFSVLSGSCATPLPESTQEMLKKLNLDPSILSGVDQELQVPLDFERAFKGSAAVVLERITE